MKIRLSPVRCNAQLDADVVGDVLTIRSQVIGETNGGDTISTQVALDFGPLEDGGVLPQSAIDCQWVCSDVERIDGEICLTIMLPHGANAPNETRFPAAYTVPMTVVNSPVPLPPYDAPPVVDDVQLPEIELEVTP